MGTETKRVRKIGRISPRRVKKAFREIVVQYGMAIVPMRSGFYVPHKGLWAECCGLSAVAFEHAPDMDEVLDYGDGVCGYIQEHFGVDRGYLRGFLEGWDYAVQGQADREMTDAGLSSGSPLFRAGFADGRAAAAVCGLPDLPEDAGG